MSIRYRSALRVQQVREALRPFGVSLSERQGQQVAAYIDLLLLWNQKVNLTSITEPIQIISRHFGESFFAAKIAGIEEGRLADVGSGAGFPGLALKIFRPRLQVTLIEPNLKKAAFLSEVVRRLDFDSVQVLRRRYEDIPGGELTAEWITARALGQYDKLLRWGESVLVGGRLVLLVGENVAREVSAAPGWRFEAPVPIPMSRERVILVGRPL